MTSTVAATAATPAIDVSLIKQKALGLGFHKVGIAIVEPEERQGRSSEANRKGTTAAPPSTDSVQSPEDLIQPAKHNLQRANTALQSWLAQGYHADMSWMENPKRQDICAVMPTVRSIICVALNYYTPHARPEGAEYAKISRYGWGRDYHRVLHKRLKAFATWLEAQADGIEARYYADTGPVQDKVWAEQAGIGWIAKNGNVITREYGSWVFLGEVLTNLELPPDRPHTQHCGTCTRCLEACPTQAIVHPFVVNANRCIAYHTIENRADSLPPEIAHHMQGWIAGCDICQDVCPWNQRFAQATDVSEFQPYPWNIAPTLEAIAHLSDQEWDQRFPASALRRIKPNMLRRNARANLESRRLREQESEGQGVGRQ